MEKVKSKILTSNYLSDHIYFTARRDAYELPSGKVVDPYFVVEMPPSVTCFALTQEGKVIMVKQYRHPLGEEFYELPGGFIDAGEDPGVAVARELLEETGYSFSNITFLARTAANPGVLNNYSYLFLAEGGRKTADQKLDANEEIDLHFFSIPEIEKMLLNSEIIQSMHALCSFYALRHLSLR